MSRSIGAWTALVLACVVVFAGGAVRAEAPGVDVGTLHLQGARSEGGMLLPSSRLLEAGGWDLSLTYGHEGGVLRARVATESIRGGARSAEATWLEDRDTALLQLALSPIDRLELAAGIPMLLGQTVSSDAALEAPRSGSTAFGDLRVGMRWALLGSGAGGWGATLQGGLLVPSGGSDYGAGDSKARADVAGSLGFAGEDGWAAHLHVGHLMGQQRTIGDQLLGDTAYGGLLLQYRHPVAGRDLQWSLEAVSRQVLAAADPGTDPRRTSLEVLAGARYFMDGIYADLGGGVGAVDDGVTPAWRVLASIGVRGLWEREPPPPPAVREIHVMAAPAQPAPAPEPAPATQPAEPAQKPADPKEAFRTLAVQEQAIFFEVGRAELDEIARGVLRTVALNLIRSERKVLITGYADDQGTKERNEDLSRRRAQSVREALIDAGVDGGRLRIEAAGDESPVAPSTGFGRSINRRVTFTWLE